jgi:hypothetical protein
MLMPVGLGQYAGAGQPQSGCPSGQWNPSLNVCCAPGNGTVSAEDDPCSILNTPGYLSEQAQVQQQAIEGAAGNQSGTLAELVGYSQPIQTAALNCVSNPGLKYTDEWGNQVSCPSQEVDDNGIEVSAFTAAQLAAMIQPSYATTLLPANAFTGTTISNPITSSTPVGGSVPAAAVKAVAPSAPSGPVASGSTNTSGSSGSSGSTNTSGTSNAGSSVDLSFLTDDSLISGIPNWGVAFGALAALMILPGIINSIGRR